MSSPFDIHSSATEFGVSSGAQATLTFSVTNRLTFAVDAHLELDVPTTGLKGWLQLKGSSVRSLKAGETGVVKLHVRVPANAAPRAHTFTLRVTDVANPNDYFAISPEIHLQVTKGNGELAPQTDKQRRLWVAGGVLLLAGLAYGLYTGPGRNLGELHATCATECLSSPCEDCAVMLVCAPSGAGLQCRKPALAECAAADECATEYCYADHCTPGERLETFFPGVKSLSCPERIGAAELQAGAPRSCTLTVRDSAVEVSGPLSKRLIEDEHLALTRQGVDPFQFADSSAPGAAYKNSPPGLLEVTPAGVTWSGTIELTGPFAARNSAAKDQAPIQEERLPGQRVAALIDKQLAAKLQAAQPLTDTVFDTIQPPDASPAKAVRLPRTWGKVKGTVEPSTGAYELLADYVIPPGGAYSGSLYLHLSPEGPRAHALINGGAAPGSPSYYESPVDQRGRICTADSDKCVKVFELPW